MWWWHFFDVPGLSPGDGFDWRALPPLGKPAEVSCERSSSDSRELLSGMAVSSSETVGRCRCSLGTCTENTQH